MITSTNDSRFGVGFAVPKDFEDGSFANKVPTSDDKLLKQLLGEKAAKAHLDARKAKAIFAKPPNQTLGKPHLPQRKDESEDEEEGRASAFKSKKQKTKKKPAKKSRDHESESDGSAAQDAPIKDDLAKNTSAQMSDDHDDEETKTETSKSKQPPSKPVGFLDQILAERSKKKKKKSKS